MAKPRKPQAAPRAGMSSLVRMLSVLDVFTEVAPAWAVEDIAGVFGYTRSTAYRYVRELAEAGLLVSSAGGRYCLGPRILKLDRQLRLSDPMVAAFRRIEPRLRSLGAEQVWLLCRIFGDDVICVHESGGVRASISFARGYPMPLLRGATSKAILACLPDRQLQRLYLADPDAVSKAGLGRDWKGFKAGLRDIRRRGHVVSVSEVDRGVFGIAAPVFDADGRVAGSISCVRPVSLFDEGRTAREAKVVMDTARLVTAGMAESRGTRGTRGRKRVKP